MSREFQVGDQVRYVPGYLGYRAAEVVGFDVYRVIIEFTSGKQISCYPDELEYA